MTREQFIIHVERSQEAFRRFLAALCCGDMALADDIAQEAYVKAYLSCDGLENSEKFKAWVYRIGYNAFISHTRSAKSHAGYDEAGNLASDYAADSQFRYQELYEALGKLPDRERTTMLLYYMEGYAIREITEIEEISEDAVKQHLSRGRKHLRGLLSND